MKRLSALVSNGGTFDEILLSIVAWLWRRIIIGLIASGAIVLVVVLFLFGIGFLWPEASPFARGAAVIGVIVIGIIASWGPAGIIHSAEAWERVDDLERVIAELKSDDGVRIVQMGSSEKE